MAGWGDVFGKIAQHFQGRIERLKNEKASLENEKKFLQAKEFSASGSRRITAIDDRLRIIDTILANKASD